MASDAPPDPFIVTGPGTPPTSWNINSNSPIWTAILANSTLQLQGPSSPSTLSSTISISSGYFWGLVFSNSVNSTIFKDDNSPVAIDSLSNVQGGVFGMLKPTTGPWATTTSMSFGDVATKFGISSTTGPAALTSFLSLMQSGSTALSLDVANTTRNALWAVPEALYQIVVSLTFDITTTGSLSQLQSFMNKQFGLNLSLTTINPQVIFTSFTSYSVNPTTPVSVTESTAPDFNMTVQFEISGFEVSALFTSTDVKLVFSDVGTPPTGSIYQRLQSAGLTSAAGSSTSLQASSLPDSSKSNASAFDKFLSDVELWYLMIGIDNITSQSSPGSNGDIYWAVGLLGNFKIGSSPYLAALTYDSRTTLFEGDLITNSTLPSTRQYNYQAWKGIPSTPGLSSSLDFSSIYGGSSGNQPPPQVRSNLPEASIIYQQGQNGNGYSLAISLAIGDNPLNATSGGASPASKPAPSKFDWASIKFNLLLQNDGTTSSAAIQVLSYISLPLPSVAPTGSLPGIELDLRYNSADNYWFLELQADYIQILKLTDYFDSSITSHVTSTVGSLYIKSLDVMYTFNGQGDSSSFLFTGALVLGELELDLYYQYQSGLNSVGSTDASTLVWGNSQPDGTGTTTATTPWIFRAFLGATSPNSTLQSVVSSISPGTNLPSFVGKIPINPASGGNSPGKLELLPVDNDQGLLLIIQILLADLDFTFVYLSTPTTSQIVFRISVDKIPVISSIPLIKQLPQPFDSLLYLYLDGDKGLSQDDLGTINDGLTALTIPPIASQGTNGSGSSPVALQAGHHFMVLQNSNVVLDHVFNNADAGSSDPALPDTSPAAGTSSALVISPLAASTTDNSNDPAPTKGNLDVQLPFLSISGLTFQFKQASLYIDVDATMLLGPISFTVIGFEIILHLSKVTLNDLSDMLHNGFITFGIHGLSVSIDESPLEIAGVFIHTLSTVAGQTIDEYAGGVSVGFEEWQFVAVGAYEIVTSPTSNYKSVFIYAKLNGPLVSLGFATISGVRLGFGYNSVVRSPTMTELPQFPFLDGSAEGGAGNDPLKILTAMTGGSSGKAWVSPQEDAYWGAVGLTLTAFGILSVTAVLMLGFHDSGVVISVFADGIAQMPPDAPEDATLFYVEIFMLAELNTIQGYFTVQASLAPTSHVLISSCRLTGGFALVNWFNPNAHSGDFVFTVGGYHPAYTPPSWYPVPARLGISFTLGSMINITGTVYFAITPKCVMGGGGLSMTLDVGPVSAWLSISLDVFVQFKPFFYTAELKVSVGCAISINVWFVHVRISVSVGADLYIQGPDPFGGYANVDFYLFSFTIHFGDQDSGAPALDLLDFYGMVKTPGPAPAANSSATPADPMMSQLKFVLTSGIYQAPTSPGSASTTAPFPDSGAAQPWNTKAGTFGCTIDCDFAVSSAILINDQNTPQSTTTLFQPDGSSNAPTFKAKPMQADAASTVTSVLTITVWTLNPDGSKSGVRDGFGGVMVMKQVPVALWDVYNKDDDPTKTAAPDALTNPANPATMTLCMGVSLTPPVPKLLLSNIPDFDATLAFIWILASIPLPDLVTKQSTLLASGDVDASQTPPQRWAQVQSNWTTFGTTGLPILGGKVTSGVQSPGLLQMAAQTLGWDQSSPSGILAALNAASATGTGTPATPPTPSWMLNGELPDYLIANLDTQYSVLPRYSASGIAV